MALYNQSAVPGPGQHTIHLKVRGHGGSPEDILSYQSPAKIEEFQVLSNQSTSGRRFYQIAPSVQDLSCVQFASTRYNK